ncbi:hypothetical protein Q1695_007883 [Nippostrongylus brasiliensis]|nr:hypothetical protein Q1695_007883 [Nippostrongylus brasiliensis]
MTVSYNSAVSSVSTFTFFRLLLRWRGSIWKSISGELLLWLVCYYIVFVVYRFALSAEQQQTFEAIAHYCDGRLVYIPLTFMLGFFVSIIVDRWRDTFKNMGWIENLALTLANLLRDESKDAKQMRRDIIRYTILAFRDISMRVRRRFPTMETLVVAGFLNENELKHLEDISLSYNKYWVPLQWALSICVEALEKKYFEMPYAMICVQNEIKAFRTNMAQLCNYDWVPVPIAYPQVVFLAVRAYFVICLVSRQYLLKNQVNDHSDIDLYVPFMTILQFIFFVGWMKVAEALLNPLGEDDDDFECNFLIDKNIATGLCIVDDQYGVCPEQTNDCFSDPDYNPVYSEDSHLHGGDGVLTGSAEQYNFNTKGEPVKMVAVNAEHRQSQATNETLTIPGNILRRISNAFLGSGSDSEAVSIAPSHHIAPTRLESVEEVNTTSSRSSTETVPCDEVVVTKKIDGIPIEP